MMTRWMAAIAAGIDQAAQAQTFPGVVTGRVVLSGEINVVDADMLEIGEFRIQLADIEAPDADERCEADEAGSPDCGLTALSATLDLIQALSELPCVLDDMRGRNTLIATCRSEDLEPSGLDTESTNLGEVLVLLGFARASSAAEDVGFYRLSEMAAQSAGRGFWACDAATPRGWERDKRELCGN